MTDKEKADVGSVDKQGGAYDARPETERQKSAYGDRGDNAARVETADNRRAESTSLRPAHISAEQEKAIDKHAEENAVAHKEDKGGLEAKLKAHLVLERLGQGTAHDVHDLARGHGVTSPTSKRMLQDIKFELDKEDYDRATEARKVLGLGPVPEAFLPRRSPSFNRDADQIEEQRRSNKELYGKSDEEIKEYNRREDQGSIRDKDREGRRETHVDASGNEYSAASRGVMTSDKLPDRGR